MDSMETPSWREIVLALIAAIAAPLIGAFLALLFIWAKPVMAQERVDVALVLAVDHSSSVSREEWRLQMAGYASAFRSEAVWASIESGAHQAIAVAMFRFSGDFQQYPLIEWTRIATAADAERLAKAIEAHSEIAELQGTCVRGALDFAERLLADVPFQAERLVVDVSGDEAGLCKIGDGWPAATRDRLADAGVQINGLPILNASPPQIYSVPMAGDGGDLVAFYRKQVVGGPGGFLVVAGSHAEFGEAVQRKLMLEIAALENLNERSERQ
jgi:hypothetical protein